MLITKLLFLIFILICSAFYILYLWDFALVLLVVMISLPVIMLISVLIARHSISAEFSMPSDITGKNRIFPIQLDVTNRSFIPIGKAEAHIEYYNVFSDRIAAFDVVMPIQPRNSQRVTFRLSSRFCGIVKIRSAYISIYDPLRIFRFKVGKNASAEIAVMPESRDISGTVSYIDRIDEESTAFSENKPGDDPSEVFSLREYIPGDKLNRIHWKLSSKSDDFIVKEFSLPVDIPSVLFLDMKCYEDSAYTLPIFDTLIETVCSLSRFLLENERMHRIIYFNAGEKRFIDVEINDLQSMNEVIKSIVTSVRDNLYCLPPEKYFSEDPTLSASSFTFISSSQDHALLSYIDEEIDADIKNAVIIIKDHAGSSEVKEMFDRLDVIPVVIGRISSSIKDIDI